MMYAARPCVQLQNARAAVFERQTLEETVVGFVPTYMRISTATGCHDELESLFEINHCLSDSFELIKTPGVSLILGGNVDMRGAGIAGGNLSYLQQPLPKIDDFVSPLAVLLEVIYHGNELKAPCTIFSSAGEDSNVSENVWTLTSLFGLITRECHIVRDDPPVLVLFIIRLVPRVLSPIHGKLATTLRKTVVESRNNKIGELFIRVLGSELRHRFLDLDESLDLKTDPVT